MQKHGRKTHSPFPEHFFLLTSVIIDLHAHPPFPKVSGKACVIIPCRSPEIMLPFVTENTHLRTSSCPIPSTVKYRCEVGSGPLAVNENWMWGIDCFEAMMESAGCGPHLGEHRFARKERV